jgi:tetratricopeptide (TPR) repeat protein
MHELAAQQRPAGKVTAVPGEAAPRREIAEYNESLEEFKQVIEKKDWQAARLIQHEIIRKNPNLIIHYTNIEQTYFDQNLFDEAWDILQRAYQIAPDSFVVALTIGTYYLRRNDFVHAEEACRELLFKAPLEALILLGLAWSLINLNKYAEAVDFVFSAIENNRFLIEEKSAMDIVNRIGVYMYKNGDAQRAVSLFEWALTCNPDDPDLLVNLGKVYYDNKDYQHARQMLQKVKEINPADEEATMGLNLIDRIIGRAA